VDSVQDDSVGAIVLGRQVERELDRGLWDVFFFFFQAEDGIRDFHVTGVQTCALPILARLWFAPPAGAPAAANHWRATPRAASQKIGRASCRERVEITVGAGSSKKKKMKMG